MASGNKYYQELRLKLIQKFGGKCERCEEPDTTKLHFAHKIGHRLNYGRSRGSNHRTREVQKEPMIRKKYITIFLIAAICVGILDTITGNQVWARMDAPLIASLLAVRVALK